MKKAVIEEGLQKLYKAFVKLRIQGLVAKTNFW